MAISEKQGLAQHLVLYLHTPILCIGRASKQERDRGGGREKDLEGGGGREALARALYCLTDSKLNLQ